MDVPEMEEKIRAKVLVGSSYVPLGSQIRWLSRKMKQYVGGSTNFIDRDSFVRCCLCDLTLIGCRDVVVNLFEKYKEFEGDEIDLLDINQFATRILSTSGQQEADLRRRAVGAIY
jgi:hypothetical protein|tara:strand:- start:878 stop:1222 length:345 start_codon:yes stop_codon:yes gene_type:complete